jgi:Ig-like domain from next to BRCA1 gene
MRSVLMSTIPRKLYQAGILLVLLAFLLSSCELSAPGEGETTTPAPEALFTAAAQTAEAMRLERFGKTQSPEAQSLIETAAGPAPTATSTTTITPAQSTPATAVSNPTAAGATGNQAEFVADVNIPDGTVFAPSQTFTKTWRLSNTGQTTWTTGYALVFIDGDLLGAEAAAPLPEEVAPGKNVDVSVDMVAPEQAGTYISYWKLKTPDGKIFGFGSTGSEAIWVKISVQAGAAALGTPESTPLANTSSAVQVSLSVDNPEVSDTCPHTFVFTAQLDLSKAATVAFALEAGDTAGSSIRVPLPVRKNLEAGSHQVVYEVTVTDSVTGWARVRVTEPAQAVSNQVNITLTCG